jgi:hypothetical protein
MAHFMHREAEHEDRGEFPAPDVGVGRECPREERRFAQLQALEQEGADAEELAPELEEQGEDAGERDWLGGRRRVGDGGWGCHGASGIVIKYGVFIKMSTCSI